MMINEPIKTDMYPQHLDPLNAEVPQETSCIFYGNIPYVATEDELK